MEYTVTYPIHLGQEVWVDTRILPTQLMNPVNIPKYVKADVRALIIQKKGEYSRKSMKLLVEAEWQSGDPKLIYGVEKYKYEKSYKLFKMSVRAIGKTVFLDKPEE